ncbi:hypothetical protein DSO57_1036601 [Entomophthora muscae]|uniref:Uncharacterized protein n=1 Tax=Entomophthora muscae TaxID=34485 RepID=A0ACC2TXR2_9FUNG|nr:hypothetical protein DSO57_1036601 [Entomophthora muscae]
MLLEGGYLMGWGGHVKVMHTPSAKSESYPYAGVPSPQQPTAPFHSEDYLTNSSYPVAYPAAQYPYHANQSPYNSQQSYVPNYQSAYQPSYQGYQSTYQGKLPALAQINPYAQRNPFMPHFDMHYNEDIQRNYLAAWNPSRPQERLPPPLRPRPQVPTLPPILPLKPTPINHTPVASLDVT